MGISAYLRRRRPLLPYAVPVAVLAAVAVLVLAPGTGASRGSSVTGTVAPPAARCLPDPDLDHQDFRTGTAAWVLPCLGPKRYDLDIPMPPGVLRGPAAASLVRTLQAKTYDADPFHSCPSATYPGIGVEVGFTDGTVSGVGLSGCGGFISPGNQQVNADFVAFADSLASRLQLANATGITPAIGGTSPPCPATVGGIRRFVLEGSTPHEVGSRETVLARPAVGAVVCRYQGGRLAERVRRLDAERLLLASASGWYLHVPGLHALAWDDHRVPASTYAVRLVDKTWTWGAFTVTRRHGTVTFYRADGTYERFGYASPVLLRALGLDTP